MQCSSHLFFGSMLLLIAGAVSGCASPSAGKSAPPANAAADAGSPGVKTELPPPADPVGFRPSGTLSIGRTIVTATRLSDGRVLIVGGEREDFRMLATVEIYDPVSESVSPAAPLPEPRAHHTATLLPSGEVLVTGGGQGSQISVPAGTGELASALLYDPIQNTWRATGAMSGARAGHRAVALADGRVLVTGGGNGMGYACAAIHPDCTVAKSIATTEIYDPKAGTFSDAGNLAQARLAFTLDLLDDGRVVAAAGAANNDGLKSVELFDPKTGVWSKGPNLEGQRLFHGSTVLSGSLIVVGGKIANVSPVSTTDVLDVSANVWRRVADVKTPRTDGKLVALRSGRALLVGGMNQIENATLAEAQIYDPTDDKWTPIASLARGRSGHAVVLLDDGSVLVVGGRDDSGVIRAIERTH